MTAQPSTHTVKAFDDDLEQLRATVAELRRWAEAAVAPAIRAPCRFESEAADEALALDRRISVPGEEVERRGIRLIALRAPMADDLREVVVSLKISDLVRRASGHARSIARRLPAVATQAVIVMPPANLLFASQTLAKVAGHSAEIVRLVHFAATGRRPAPERPIESPDHAFS